MLDDEEFILDMSPEGLRDRLLMPPKPPLDSWSPDRKRRQRQKRLWWLRRRDELVRKHWPVVLASFMARFPKRKRWTKIQIRSIDAELVSARESIRRQNKRLSETNITRLLEKWAEQFIQNLVMAEQGEAWDTFVKEIFEEYDKYLEGLTEGQIVKFTPIGIFPEGSERKRQ